MSRHFAAALGLVAALMTTTAAAQTKPKAPADAPKAYTVEFVFEGTTYSVTMTLTVAKGTVSGPMMIDQPVPVTGDVPAHSRAMRWRSTTHTPSRATSPVQDG